MYPVSVMGQRNSVTNPKDFNFILVPRMDLVVHKSEFETMTTFLPEVQKR